MPQFQSEPNTGSLIGSTTLSSAVTSTSQTTVQLASVSITVGPYTGPVAKNPQWALIIDNEIMLVTADPVGTSVSVTRGAYGTQAQRHASGQTVWACPVQYAPASYALYSNLPPSKFRYSTVPVGSVAYGSFGTDTTLVAGTLYVADVYVPQRFLATGIGVLNAGTVGTNKGISALYDYSGNLVASSAVAGATTSGADAFQARAFSPGPIFIPGGKYWIAYQANGTTDTITTVAASTFIDVLTKSQTGTFATIPSSIALPTTFTADVGPVAYIY